MKRAKIHPGTIYVPRALSSRARALCASALHTRAGLPRAPVAAMDRKGAVLGTVGVSDRGVLNQLVNLFCVLPIPDGDAKRHKVYTSSGNRGPTSSLRGRSCIPCTEVLVVGGYKLRERGSWSQVSARCRAGRLRHCSLVRRRFRGGDRGAQCIMGADRGHSVRTQWPATGLGHATPIYRALCMYVPGSPLEYKREGPGPFLGGGEERRTHR